VKEKSEEAETGSNPAESSKEGCGSKGAVLPMTMIMTIIVVMMMMMMMMVRIRDEGVEGAVMQGAEFQGGIKNITGFVGS
jgi:hypothetical protein